MEVQGDGAGTGPGPPESRGPCFRENTQRDGAGGGVPGVSMELLAAAPHVANHPPRSVCSDLRRKRVDAGIRRSKRWPARRCWPYPQGRASRWCATGRAFQGPAGRDCGRGERPAGGTQGEQTRRWRGAPAKLALARAASAVSEGRKRWRLQPAGGPHRRVEGAGLQGGARQLQAAASVTGAAVNLLGGLPDPA